MASSSSLLERVPLTLMEPFDNYEAILPGALPAFLADLKDVGAALGYIGGALDHQQRVHDEKSKRFKGTIDRITYEERKSGDYVLGRKATIHFRGAGKGGDDEEQSINTDWVEYRSFNPENEAFYVALSKTIVDFAEENIGRECFIRKAFKETGNPSNPTVRYIASIELSPDGKKQSGDSGAKRNSGGSSAKSSRSQEGDGLDFDAITKLVRKDKKAGESYDELDSKTIKRITNLLVDTIEASKADDRYDIFVGELEDGSKLAKKVLDLIDDALDQDEDADIVCDLFIIAADELG